MLVTIIYIGGVLMTDNDYVNLITSTAYWIKRSELTNTAYYNLRSKLSTLNFQENEVPVAFYEVNSPIPYIAIPKIDRNLLDHIVGRTLQFEREYGHHKAEVSYSDIPLTLYPHQVGIVKDINRIFSDPTTVDKRVLLALQPGLGKSLISAVAIHDIKQKFLFIVYSKKLVSQTCNVFKKYLGSDGMCMLERGSDFDELDYKKIKGLFMSHSMLRSLVKQYSWEYVMDIIENKIGASIKIIDEFDREVGMLYKLECFSNFKYSLYLTGTAYKSLKPDDAVFQTIYRKATKLGANVRVEPNKKGYIINWRFNPTSSERFKLTMRDSKLFKTYYNDYLARKDVFLDYVMQKFYTPEDSLIKRIQKDDGITILYCGRIENCELVKQKLIKNFGIPESDIGIFNSDISDRVKLESETKPFICTTCSSMGRGYDNSKIRVLIYLEFSFSVSEAEQSYSRVGRLGGDEGYVIWGIDKSFFQIEMNHRKKEKLGLFNKHFKSVEYLTIPENYYQFYVNGYRPDTEFAKEIIEKKKNKKVKLSKKIF